MRHFRSDDSGVFGTVETTRRVWFEPETIVLVVVWLLSVVVVLMGVARGDGFGPDRSIALAFAIGTVWLGRGWLLDRTRSVAKRLFAPIRHARD